MVAAVGADDFAVIGHGREREGPQAG